MEHSFGKTILISVSCFLFFVSISLFCISNFQNNVLSNKNINCEYELSGEIYTIDARCILNNKLPSMSLAEIIDLSRNQISDFSGVYEPYTESFAYYGAIPIFSSTGSIYLTKLKDKNQTLLNNARHMRKISFSRNDLAHYYAEQLSYYVADKDLSNLGTCTLTNYNLALESMDNYVFPVDGTFNANQHLINIDNYCKGQSEHTYLFYGGVCGMVSQLFRISLLNPNIEITKRFSHNERFVKYYGEKIGGDDAAVYERSKQFEIKNVGNSDIIFKVRRNGNKTQLIAISQPNDKRIEIRKSTINGNNKAIHLEKSVFEGSGENLIKTEIFDSYYSRKNYSNR